MCVVAGAVGAVGAVSTVGAVMQHKEMVYCPDVGQKRVIYLGYDMDRNLVSGTLRR